VSSFDSIRQRAVELAQTGRHIDCLTIEIALEREGFSLAFEALRDGEFRAQLSALCATHWGPSSPDASPDGRDSPNDGRDEPSFDGMPYPLAFARRSGSSEEA